MACLCGWAKVQPNKRGRGRGPMLLLVIILVVDLITFRDLLKLLEIHY